MKLSILIVFCLFISFTQMQAQIFGGKPKSPDDLKFYPEQSKNIGSNHTDAEIIAINDIELSTVEKVFPGVKMREILTKGRSWLTGDVIYKKQYYPFFKRTYWSRPEYLPELELKTNKNKFSLLSLKERIEAYITLSFYKELNCDVKIQDIEIKEILNSPDTNLIHKFYNINIIANGINYNGIVLIINNKIINIFLNGINKGVNYASNDGEKGSLNIINTDSPENYNNPLCLYKKVKKVVH